MVYESKDTYCRENSLTTGRREVKQNAALNGATDFQAVHCWSKQAVLKCAQYRRKKTDEEKECLPYNLAN